MDIMQGAKQLKNKEVKKPRNKKVIKIAIITVAVALALVVYPFIQWSGGNIVHGVKYNSHDLSDMTYAQIKQLTIDSLNIKLNKGVLKLNDDETGNEILIAPKDIDAFFDESNIFSDAYNIGRVNQSNNIFSAVFQIYRAGLFGLDLQTNVNYNPEKLDSILNSYLEDFEVISKVPTYVIEQDELLISPGKDGRELNIQKTADLIVNKMSRFDFSTAQCVFDQIKAEPIDIDEIHKNVVQEVSDAKVVLDSSGKQTVQIEVMGVDFDLESAKRQITDLYSSYTIPLTITQPKITYRDLYIDPELGIFKDVLASFSTYLDTSLVNRTHNVRLAANKINGTILNPKEEFSFNKVVGPREFRTGFLEAKVYMANEIVDGVGGGICQVSSTLYVASLLADMDITERSNHRFTVSYVKPGYDATISYGIIDYRFKNPYDSPVRITSKLEGNKLTIQIRGANIDNKSYSLSHSVYNYVNFSTRYKTDTSIPVGTTKVSQGGQQGYSAQLFSSYTRPDGTVERKLINTSVYHPADRIILTNEPVVPDVPDVPDEPDEPGDQENTPGTKPDGPGNSPVPGIIAEDNDKDDKNKLPSWLGGPGD